MSAAELDTEQDAGFLVYGVVRPAERDSLPGKGVDGAPVRLVVHGTVAAAVSEITLPRPPGRRADLMAYSEVIHDLQSGGVVVPVQFASVLPSEHSVVEDLLRPQEDAFDELLDQLVGRCQLNIRASYEEGVVLAEVVARNPVIAELRERTRGVPEEAAYAERLQLGELVAEALMAQRELDTARLCEVVLPLTAAHLLTVGSGLEVVVDLNVLVDDDRQAELEQRLEELAEAEHGRMRIRLVGPVAPFDFLGGASWA